MSSITDPWFARLVALGTSTGDAATRPLLVAARLGSAATNVLSVALLGLLVLAQPAMRETGPGWLKKLDLAVTFLDRDGREIGRRGIRHADTPRLDELPPHLVAAVLATEDRRFWRHWGIDPVGLVRALVTNVQAEGVVQGGSTITQQLAKNLFLSGERTVERKINEAFLALWLEVQLTKPQILKLYLDRAYLGGGTFGIEAASTFYFGKSSRDVTLAEAAALAGLFKAPSRYAPHLGRDAARARASDVLDNLVAAGLANGIDVEAAKREPAKAVPRPREEMRPDYYLDYAFREVQRLAARGAFGDGTVLTVQTALDPLLQQHADTTIQRALEQDGERLSVDQAALIVMEPGGAVRALVGGSDYGESQFNRAVEAHRQPGSAYKPFVYAAALAHAGYRPGTIVNDAEICIGRWCPANYGRGFAGQMTLATALARSINTVAVRLSVEIGRAAGAMGTSAAASHGRGRIIALARELGLGGKVHDTPSLPLGSSETTLLDLTSAYAAFASGGLRAEPGAILLVRNAQGEVVYRRAPEGRRVLGQNLAGLMNAMLTKVVEVGTARRAALPGIQVAGKTGTTSAYRDAWFVGYTSELVAGIWFGNDDQASTARITGGALPAQAWHDVMAFAHRGLATPPLPGPSQEDEGGFVSAGLGRERIREVAPRTARDGTATVARAGATFREAEPPSGSFAWARLRGSAGFREVVSPSR